MKKHSKLHSSSEPSRGAAVYYFNQLLPDNFIITTIKIMSIMDDTTITSDTASTKRRNLLEQLMAIRSLMPKENDDDSRDVIKDLAKKGITLNREQLTALSTEFLLTVLLDAMFLRLLDEGPAGSSDRQQVVDDAAAAKKKRKAAAKKRRYKRNKAAAKHKKTKLMSSWMGGGIISVIMMVAFSFISTPIVTLSLFQPSDGSGEGKAPPALPPSASKSLRQEDLESKNEASTSPDIIISPVAAVVPPPVFALTALSNGRMKADEMRASTCFDTPNWKDSWGEECDYYEEYDRCPSADFLAGDKGSATMNCCICGGGSHSLPPTNSPTITYPPSISANPSSSPTKSANPSTAPSTAPSICTDTEGWYDDYGYDCVWYEVNDLPGCPEYGYFYKENNPAKGLANENCCYCKNAIAIVSTPSPTNVPSSSSTSVACIDTPGWKDEEDYTCNDYERDFDPGCPDIDEIAGDMGAMNHCCYCKNPSCEDFRSKCQKNTNILDVGFNEKGLAPFCEEEAESFCCEAAGHDHDVKIVSNIRLGVQETVGLYNECKCDFWVHLCEDTRVGEACDHAAEHCCGDYMYDEYTGFLYQNSPMCYCDFYNYAQNEFDHKLKPKALNISKEFSNPCNQFQRFVDLAQLWSMLDYRLEFERPSLEAIYNGTNGQNWTNSAGWMNETVDHCQWYGITCDSDRYVSGIDLRDNNLAGQFPIYSRTVFDWEHRPESWWIATKYGLANIYNLRTLDLSDNKLTGTIEYLPLYNLHSLTHFDVSGNQLSGEVNALVSPSLTYVDFHKNRFTSMRRFEKYKVSPLQTLRFCDVSNNAIQKDATELFENIPPNIEQFFASNSEIYGSLPTSLNNLPKLRQFGMSSNALSGSLPGFTESFITLQKLDMSNQTNGFTEQIPDNIWRSLSLKILNLADNRLTGSIPSLVGNLAVLEVFNLTSNIIKGSIPSELGMLEGSLQFLGLSNNTFTGSIPFQIGRLQGTSVMLEGNSFDDSSTAPLSLCIRSIEEFDLANDETLCPVERNALSDFYDSTKGAEWTESAYWRSDEDDHCNWYGVSCKKGRVTNLTLANNGLSGRLKESIGDLALIEVLDLSDNDIKGSIPAAIGLLSKLTYLRLSYNAFTGTAKGLEGLTELQLLHLQSNRITEMPNMTQLNDTKYENSTFVSDCGVPSAFDEAPKCKDCTMCCNANDDCYPTEKTKVAKWGYGNFAAVFFACFIVICCVFALFVYRFGTSTTSTGLEEDDKYALSKIGKESVYSYFVTDKPLGWLAAFATLVMQVVILVFFILASEADNLQKDTIDIQFTWKCPRDSDVCDNKADLTKAGWVIFSMLMIAFLAKDMINGCKLIYHSSKVSHTLGSRIRYFIGGMCLCSITLFAFYVSTVYNKAIATSNTAIIVNSVIVLFIMEIDEYIFSAVDAINEKWTEHAADKEVSEMKDEIKRQRAQIESQQKEIDNQRKDLGMLRKAVEKIEQSQAAEASDSDSQSAECEDNTDAPQIEQVDQDTMPSETEQNIKDLLAAAWLMYFL